MGYLCLYFIVGLLILAARYTDWQDRIHFEAKKLATEMMESDKLRQTVMDVHGVDLFEPHIKDQFFQQIQDQTVWTLTWVSFLRTLTLWPVILFKTITKKERLRSFLA